MDKISPYIKLNKINLFLKSRQKRRLAAQKQSSS